MKAKPFGSSIRGGPVLRAGRDSMSANPMAQRLWREIATALALKTLALLLIYFLCFDASKRPRISPAAVAEKLFARDRG
jgi:hypothetical protein